MAQLESAVEAVWRGVGAGEVATYGEIAEEDGFTGRARAVGHILASSDGNYPWWRVVAANGRLVPGSEAEQAALLRAEGVDVGQRGVTGMGRRRAVRRTARTQVRRSPR